MKFSQNFAGISQNFSNFDEPDNFYAILRKMRQICRKFGYFWQAGSLEKYPPPPGVAEINLNSPVKTSARSPEGGVSARKHVAVGGRRG